MLKNPSGMLKTIAEMQKRVTQINDEISVSIFHGEAAQGLVKVSINGKGEVQRVDISPAVMAEGAETVGDLVAVAARKANEAKETELKKKMSGITSGLLPFGIKIPGLG